jgi:protein-tyrosine phosphatase
VDFDTASLRASLPGTVTRLHSLLETGNTVYIHCTAGLGRAPGVAITYLHWLFDLSLEDAYSYFTERRKCNPR